jgi:general secretion pathway protein A
MNKLLALYGLKYHPFLPDVPTEGLYRRPVLDSFIRRVESSVLDGGFASVTGDPGSGKTVTVRLVEAHLRDMPDVTVATLQRPSSSTGDFYRELGDLFGVSLASHSRWAGFKGLRAKWCDHIASTRRRPVLIIDEAQECLTPVLNELRILASKELDTKQLLCVIFAGDGRFPERLRTPELLPLGSRIRRRLVLDYASRDELLASFEHLLERAGNPTLMTPQLQATLVDHCAGNYRILMNLADELLSTAADRDLPRLDEKLYLEVYGQSSKPKTNGKKR